ncbi:MAG: hypothetical protein SWK90_19365 [Chloroflexota bacterium]|nr:hypothetical protein [Chloroflexota bacterium]
MTHRKKLIEVALPLEAINQASACTTMSLRGAKRQSNPQSR